MKHAVRIATLALVALVLLYVLCTSANLGWFAVAHSFDHVAGWALAAIVALLGANLALATMKWLFVMRAMEPDHKSHPPFADAMLATTFGALLGQAMPFQVGVALSRSMAGKLGVGWSPSANLGTTVYEQAFDAVVVGAAGVVAIPGYFLHLKPASWAALIVLSGGLVVAVSLVLPFLLGVFADLLRRVPLGHRFDGLAARMHCAVGRAATLSRRALVILALLSVLRYATNLFLILVLLSALDLLHYAAPTAAAFPLIQVVAFVPITPGNLGVVEWSWSAALVSAGASFGAAATFALTTRVASFVALLILIAPLLAARLVQTLPGK